MRQGMAVNKQNLSAVYRQMGMYPDAEIMDLVMLHKMEIPVSDENLSMMRLYQTNRHYLFSDLQGLSGQLSDFLSEMIQTQPTDAVQNFIRGFLDIFQEPSDTVIQNQAAAVQNAENHQAAEYPCTFFLHQLTKIHMEKSRLFSSLRILRFLACYTHC